MGRYMVTNTSEETAGFVLNTENDTILAIIDAGEVMYMDIPPGVEFYGSSADENDPEIIDIVEVTCVNIDLIYGKQGHGRTRRPVAAYDTEGNLDAIYPSIKYASEQTGAYMSDITMCAQQRPKTNGYRVFSAGGYVWRFANELDDGYYEAPLKIQVPDRKRAPRTKTKDEKENEILKEIRDLSYQMEDRAQSLYNAALGAMCALASKSTPEALGAGRAAYNIMGDMLEEIIHLAKKLDKATD